MSRIAGICCFTSSGLDAQNKIKQMVSVLPGPHCRELAAPDFAVLFAHSGWDASACYGLAEDQDIYVAFDGKILNDQELRLLVTESGTGDAALVAALIRRFDFPTALAHIVGDFAVAAYDARTHSLYLGRDRLGVKPLYWCKKSQDIAFASQPRGLFPVLEQVSVNKGFVARFAASHYRVIDNNRMESPYENIAQLPAGHWLQVRDNGAVKGPICWWEITAQPVFSSENRAALAEEYRALLLAAVARRVRATRNPLFTLSGGLDSSSILCCAVEAMEMKLPATSSLYVDALYDERHEIMDVVDEKTTKWLPVELGNEIEIVDLVSHLVRLHDEPVATATWLSHHFIVESAHAHGFTALFGGLGGDELNAGEFEYFPLFFADLRQSGLTDKVAAEITNWIKWHNHPIHQKSSKIAEDMMTRLIDPNKQGQCRPDHTRMTRYYDSLHQDFFDLSTFEPIMDGPFTSYLLNRTYQDMMRETLPCCLRAEDRHCAALGLEHFDPFLDHELITFMYRIPGELKIQDGITKHLLREAMRGILPEATRTRIKKTGWNAPAHRWFGGKTLEALRDRVTSTSFSLRGIYRPDRVLALIDEHETLVKTQAAQENHMMFLWQLLNLDLWLESL